MADTSFAVGDPLTVKRWSRILFEEALKDTVVYRFIGKGGDNVFQIKDELKKGEGDKITYGLRMQLRADPHVGDSTLRGQEEKLTFYNDSLVVDLVRHGVSVRNRDMTRQRVPYDVRQEAMIGLKDYFEGLMDEWFFNHLCGNTVQTNLGRTGLNTPLAPSDTSHQIWANPGTNSTDDGITTAGTANANEFSLSLIDTCVLNAKTITPMIRPITVDGKKKYVIFIHPQQAEDMRTNTNTGQWLDIQKAAMQGGDVKGNPIFTDALAEYHNTVIIEDTRVTLGVNHSVSTTAVATVRRAVFCGAQAGVIAFGRNEGAKGDKKSAPIYWREQMDDYEEELGVSANMIGGLKKAQMTFDQGTTQGSPIDFGTIVVSTFSAT